MSSTETATPKGCGAREPQKRRPRRRGDDRVALRGDLATKYGSGSSIRVLAEEYDLSYGLTRALLLEADVELRTRSGAPRGQS